jgi:hypothetical protein
MARSAEKLAREAGEFAARDPEITPEGNPFPPGDPQHKAWLEGYADVLDGIPDIATQRRQIAKALEEAS